MLVKSEITKIKHPLPSKERRIARESLNVVRVHEDLLVCNQGNCNLHHL